MMVGRVMMVLALAGTVLLPPGGAGAQDQAPAAVAAPSQAQARLWRAMRLDEMMPVLRDEALIQADEMAGMLFERGSDAGWRDRVAAIHAPARLTALLQSGLADQQDRLDSADLAQALTFYESPLGARIARLELEGRVAMLDGDTEDSAFAAFADAEAIEAPRAAMIRRLIDETGLVEQNVASGLNAALAFSKGFADADGYQIPMSEDELLAETWAQEDEIRSHTEEWITAYLYLCYGPLSDAELDEFIRFAGSKPGTALWAVLLDGFDAIYERTSYEMGQAAALHISGRQL